MVYLDPRGIGRSERLDDASLYAMNQYVEDIEVLREYLRLKSFALAGHCHGGFVALLYATKYPGHLDHLIILDSSPYEDWSDHQEWSEGRSGYQDALKRYHDLASRDLTPEEKRRAAVTIFAPVTQFHDYEKVAAIMNPVFARMDFAAKPVIYWSQEEMGHFDVRDELYRITAPLLIITGEDDFPMMSRGSRVLHDAVSKSEHFVVPAAGHWPWIEQPELTMEKMCHFLAGDVVH